MAAGCGWGEAADLIDHYIQTQPPRSVYDALLLPALTYAERDRLEERLSADDETAGAWLEETAVRRSAAAFTARQRAAMDAHPSPAGP